MSSRVKYSFDLQILMSYDCDGEDDISKVWSPNDK